jgi:uncharacterized membrane protein YheB (UPF0754 family)
LAFLEKKFLENKNLRKPHLKRIQTNIDWALNKKPKSISELKSQLEKESISMMIWKNKENVTYGITYIDHKTKCVFNGSELGKPYSAKGIIERCHREIKAEEKEAVQIEQKIIPSEQKSILISSVKNNEISNMLSNFSEPNSSGNYIPYQLKKRRKKKKKKRLSV